MDRHPLKHIIEAALLTAGKPLSMQHLQQLLADDDEEQTPLAKEFVQAGLDALALDFEDRGIELKLVASGYRLQVRQSLEPWIAKLFEERPPRYSRALLETLALVGYRQPITRAEIEDVRGVSVSSNIIRTLLEREWIKVVGHRDVPGRPSMYGTTKEFLDYFNLTSLSELPELGQLMDLDKATAKFDKANGDEAANDGEEGEREEGQDAEVVAEGENAEATAESDSSDESEVDGESTDENVASAEDDSEQLAESDDDESDVDAEAEPQESEDAASTESETETEVTAESEEENAEAEIAEAAPEEEDLADGESQEDIDADVESLIRMLDAEVGSGSASAEAPVAEAKEPQTEAATESSHSEDQSTQHEAASGESITPADLLRRHSTDFVH